MVGGEMDEPVGRRRLNFAGLSPDEFEQLCFLAIEIDHKGVVHVADPDGGVDVGLPTPERDWERCWQAKRFTAQVSWPQCTASLDAAVARYGMPHYTFCFARDLTHKQEGLFKKHLVERHEGVTVDYWDESKIEALLLSSAQGERIANAFYGDPTIDTRAIMRAIRAGGALDSGLDVMERLGEIADYLERSDPFYSYVVVANEAGTPGPALSPGTLVAAASVEGGFVRRIDAVPRSAAALEKPPSGTIYFASEQAAAFDRFIAEGGELRLENVGVRLENIPSGLPQPDPMPIEEGGWTVILRSEPGKGPAPWNARFVMKTPEGKPVTVEIRLMRSEPPEDWDGLLRGEVGGLEASMLLRSRDGRGQIQLNWSYSDVPRMSTAMRSTLLAFVEALHRGGSLGVEDVDGPRPRLDFSVPEREVDPRLSALRQYVDDVLTIEEWVGYELPVPEGVPAGEAQAIHVAAMIIRAGESEMNIEGISMSVTRAGYQDVSGEEPVQFLFEQAFGLAVLGTEISIGVLRGVVAGLRIIQEGTEVAASGEELVRLRLEPITEESRHPVFELGKGLLTGSPMLPGNTKRGRSV